MFVPRPALSVQQESASFRSGFRVQIQGSPVQGSGMFQGSGLREAQDQGLIGAGCDWSHCAFVISFGIHRVADSIAILISDCGLAR